MSTKTFEAWKNTKICICQNPKNTNYGVQSKQQTGGTRNKHCNLLIYTVPRYRVLIERCYYNIQTIKYHNNAELIFLQHIYQEMSTKTLKLRKTQKFKFLKIQKTQNTGYIQNNETGEPKIHNSICRFTQSHSTDSPTQQSTDCTLLLQYSNNKVTQ